jgi:tight adherence protein C
MPIPVLLAALAVASAVPLLWWSIAGLRSPERAAVARNLGSASVTDVRQAVLLRGAGDRAVKPALHALVDAVRHVTPAGAMEGLERRIITAGRPPAWPLERVIAAKVLAGLAALLLGTYFFLGQRTASWFLLAVAMVVLAYFAPDLLLYSRGIERRKAITKALPDTLDQMTISVEAGLGFETAMARAARNGQGPLAEELVRTLQELQLGVARPQAFRNLAERTQVPDVRHFVLAILQADAYGVPVADVLHIQAKEHRVKRRQRAEEQAMKIPVKVIFPLILCILPTLFIVILGPAAIRMATTLFGSGGPMGG